MNNGVSNKRNDLNEEKENQFIHLLRLQYPFVKCNFILEFLMGNNGRWNITNALLFEVDGWLIGN